MRFARQRAMAQIAVPGGLSLDRLSLRSRLRFFASRSMTRPSRMEVRSRSDRAHRYGSVHRRKRRLMVRALPESYLAFRGLEIVMSQVGQHRGWQAGMVPV